MAFREVRKETGPIDVDWGDRFDVSSEIVSRKRAVGEFLLRINADLSVDPRCLDGTVESATYYVDRWLNYADNADDFELGLDASSLVYDTSSGQLIAVAMVGGGVGGAGIYDIMVDPEYRNQGIGTKMIQRALCILSDKGIPTLDLWRHDEDRQACLYERLGFTPTGRTEPPPPSYTEAEPSLGATR